MRTASHMKARAYCDVHACSHAVRRPVRTQVVHRVSQQEVLQRSMHSSFTTNKLDGFSAV